MGSMEWEIPSPDELMSSELSRFVHFAATDCRFDCSVESLVINWLHPLMLAANSKSNQKDSPNQNQAMNGPFLKEYWESTCLKVKTFGKMKAWTVVERDVTMNVLSSTWVFKAKRYPDGLIKNFKARFCTRGDQQIEGVCYFET